MVKVKIYGKEQCAYCKKAKELAAQLQSQGKLTFEYIDIQIAGIGATELSELVGKPVRQVPQIFIDDKPVGGYTEFAKIHS
ncbi:GrxA family glutaredoxin [Cronobacter dublinensis]